MDLKTKIVFSAMQGRLSKIDRYRRKAEEIQGQQLRRIIGQAWRTDFGADCGIREDTSEEKFRRQIPVQRYEEVKPYIERMMRGERSVLTPGLCSRFAKSSGTSNEKSKFIPVPARHLRVCHYRGASDVLWLYLRNRPDSRFFSTKALVLGGSSTPVSIGSRLRVGDLSSILIEKMPALGAMLRVPTKSTLLMDEWESKMDAIVREVKGARVGSLSGVPSWMLVMIKRVLEETGQKTLSDVWPDLEVFFHGGISFDPYRLQYRQLIPSDRMQYVETYNASEGFFAIQDDPSERAMLLMLDYGVYYEFLPLSEVDTPNPEPIPLSGVEEGKPYAMLISTLGGLYRYMIGDVVTFDSTAPYRIRITGRTKHFINAFGEELMVDNADRAIASVSARLGMVVTDYTAAPYFYPDEGVGRHDWMIEFDTLPQQSDIDRFAAELDAELQQLNSDYEAKRYANMTLLPLHIEVAPKGLFVQWMTERGKLGGQHKVPRLSNERKWIDELFVLKATDGSMTES